MKRLSIIKFILTVGMVLGLTVGCADTSKKDEAVDVAAEVAADAAKAQKAISVAKAANKKVKAVGFAWRDTDKLIKKAEAEAKKGDSKSAMKLASKAKSEAELAYKQYELEQGIDRTVK